MTVKEAIDHLRYYTPPSPELCEALCLLIKEATPNLKVEKHNAGQPASRQPYPPLRHKK